MSSYTNLISPTDIGSARFIEKVSGNFDSGVASLEQTMLDALAAVNSNPSDPKSLANYQAALASYTLYRNAQSNTVKAYKDIAQGTVSNFK